MSGDEQSRLDALGSVLTGCGLGCLVQFVCLAIGAIIAGAYGTSKYGYLAVAGFGFAQWIGLVPLIVHHRRRGQSNTVMGLCIMGGIGLLLSSACASMAFQMPGVRR